MKDGNQSSVEESKVAKNIGISDISLEIDPIGRLKVYKKRYVVLTALGRRYATFIKVIPSTDDLKSIERGRLRSCQIQTSEGLSLSIAFNFQLNRVRNRWNVAIKRSSGFVLLDIIWRAILGSANAIRAFVRVVIGTRTRFSDLLEGAEFRSRTIEEQRETETMIFASIAAVMRAAHFASEGSAEIVYLDDEYMQEVKGLVFAGGMAGTLGQADAEQDDDADDDIDMDDIDMDDINMDDMEMDMDMMEMI